MLCNGWTLYPKKLCYLWLGKPYRLICHSHFQMNRVIRLIKYYLPLFFRSHTFRHFIRHLPVMSAGWGRPMMCRMEGATSASTPSSTWALVFSVM